MSNSEDAAADPLLSSEEVAKELKVSSRCVLNWYYDGVIEAETHVRKVIRFRKSAVMAALKATGDRPVPAPGEECVKLAMHLIAPDVAGVPAWTLDREPVPEEMKEASRVAAIHWANLQALETPEERRAYTQGVLDAAHMEEKS